MCEHGTLKNYKFLGELKSHTLTLPYYNEGPIVIQRTRTTENASERNNTLTYTYKGAIP